MYQLIRRLPSYCLYVDELKINVGHNNHQSFMRDLSLVGEAL